MTNLKYYIIDTTSPFFLEFKCDKVNWSKVPYYGLEKKGTVHKKTHKSIRKNFDEYVKKVSRIGYNALSIDDLSHITMFSFYPKIIRDKVRKYRKKFKKLFRIAAAYKMKVFLTTDIMFNNSYIHSFSKNTFINKIKLLKSSIEKAFRRFPELEGLIFRIGESDGQDVMCDFKSEMILKTPDQVRTMLREVLPIFEKYHKVLIFRTWTTGAYKIGDLMWNKNSFKAAFGGITSSNLIISLKYGIADFFRTLPLSPFFEEPGFKKIIELQTRREYEGFGEYPSFVGRQYYNYYSQLKGNKTIEGIHVWCQTGGWSSFKNYTYLENSSFWNELNTRVTLDIFKNGLTVEQSIRQTPDITHPEDFLDFVGYSDQVITDLLYDPGMSGLSLFFNKIRIPPQIHIFWENVTVTNLIILFYRSFNENPSLSLKKGFKSLLAIKKMKDLSKKYRIPYNFNFHFETFKIFYAVRKIIYQGVTKKSLLRLYKYIEKYKKTHDPGYKFYIHVGKKINPLFFKLLSWLLIRKKDSYRLLDRIIFNRPVSRIILGITYLMKKNLPEFTGNQAMPITTFLD